MCREPGCGSPVKVLGEDTFGRGEGQMWGKKSFSAESKVNFCLKSTLEHNCSHSSDVGLVSAVTHIIIIISLLCYHFFFKLFENNISIPFPFFLTHVHALRHRQCETGGWLQPVCW